jgi:hypothetical protein
MTRLPQGSSTRKFFPQEIQPLGKIPGKARRVTEVDPQ